ncbi:MAG: hypothetical protein JWN58_1157 [Gammaproteobacteria bacterium]|nr:hypothetical protein [Gammaproteobacteria bacterium]
MRTGLVLLCALALSGCSFKAKWHDTTGRGRPSELASPDAKECYDLSGYSSLSKASNSGDFEAFKAKLDACMAARGWELVRDKG